VSAEVTAIGALSGSPSVVAFPEMTQSGTDDDPAPPSVSVVIPTLNEAANIGVVMDRIPAWVYEVLVVDGHSTDGTREVVRSHRSDARVILQRGKGKGDALNCGFAAATGDIIVMLDADGSTDPAEIPRFVAALRTGADYAKGTRFVTGGGSADISRVRRFGNLGLNFLVNRLWGARYSDLCYGYNAFWRHHLPSLQIDCSGFEVETLLNIKATRAKLTVVEVPSYERNRLSGVSNLSAMRDGTRVLRTIIAERIRPH
jgi:glycosyltransferase involved in cell wall biosynthesis